ncbi:ALH_1b_G0016540.mRNA.1.CDS.1 [Saccharomyces cerevisiae]|nr:ADQ_G0016510.mRNA.1.CDS.1 [Saccharomyces cerevisiae]CAI4449851.1 ALH_1b_G0016540.mRNA.1.CDS.1 [Saccharomyces cerevisiae]CAI5287933.1 CNT_HP2_G0016260.mRNA.1.CDS.1 [Saccharomyces cerevisiae]CAI6584301.1 CNT_HP2_G0016260.mRNA.1.CDS.1 [Saccharomyces cerevisiae]CAI6638536.1 ALH_1b_G0016540.mRNA.1.CDS.1 [Saccharomyces cerevisiae]
MPTYLGKLTWSYFFTTLGLACAYNVTEQMEFDQFKSDYLACLAPEHRNIVVDLASNGFITISPMANATIDFEDVTSDYFNCTDVNTNVQVTIASFYNEYGFGPDDNGYYHAMEGPSEFERHDMDVRLYRPYYPGEFVMGRRSDALGVTGFDQKDCAGEGFYDEQTAATTPSRSGLITMDAAAGRSGSGFGRITIVQKVMITISR